MVRRLLLAATVLGLASVANAQPAPAPPILQTQTRDVPPPAARRAQLFISPMGEPFRGPDGFGAWFAAADADHDGAVTLAEFRADAVRFFRVLDANGDGQLDGFEMQAYERDRVPEIGVVSFEDGPRGGGRGFGGKRRGSGGPPGGDDKAPKPDQSQRFKPAGSQGAARYSLVNIPQPVAQADEDWNGRVTALEWDHAATRRFALLDKANAGRLTRDGLLAPVPAKSGKPEPKGLQPDR